MLALDPQSYRRHALHGDACAWVEKNCYIDIWIEVLHAYGLEPTAALAFTLAVDFVDDQWTFFKPPHGELWDLYGVDVQELTVWRPLLEHSLEHLRNGRLISTEADAFYLPDTQGTDYRAQHTKTTIVIQRIDAERKELGYFHNAGYFQLNGEDFEATFRLRAAPDPTFMPLFAEHVSVDRLQRLDASTLRARSRELLARHFARRPRENPISRFAARFAADMPELQARGLGHYHAYAFASVRQLGAAFELAALYLRWLSEDPGLAKAADAFMGISDGAKTLILKGARAVNAKRPFDVAALLEGPRAKWEEGMACVATYLGQSA